MLHFGFHNLDSDLKLLQAQLKQIIAQATSLSKAIEEVISTEEVPNGMATGKLENNP